jgi:hypothetical protein
LRLRGRAIPGSGQAAADKVVSVTARSTDDFLDDLAAWAKATAQDLDGNSEDAALLHDLARDYLDCPDLAELTPFDLRQLLLAVFPRKVTVSDPEDVNTVIPTMREVCRFLRDTGRIPRSRHDQLIGELDQIEPEFAGAVMDPGNWGMARTFTQAMIADGVDIGDDGAMQGWISGFSKLPDAHRNALTSHRQSALPPGLPDMVEPELDLDFDDENVVLDLAPVRLAPEAELAAAARVCPLLEEARRLAAWLGPSRQLTATGALRLADARALIAELGLTSRDRPTGRAGTGDADVDAAVNELLHRIRLEQLRSARDFTPLERLWIIAQEAGLVEVAGRRARPGPRYAALANGGHSGQDAAALEGWLAAFTALLDPEFPAPGGPLSILLQNELLGMLTVLYGASEPLKVSELADMARSAFTGRLGWMVTMTGAEDLVEETVTTLITGAAEAGAAELADGSVALSPLGVWGLYQILRMNGLPAPAIGDYAGADATEMLGAIANYDQEDGAAELAGWVARRGTGQAAAEVAAVVLAGTSTQRMSGLDALGTLGEPGRDAARKLVGEPGVGALVAMWLMSVGEDPEAEISAEDTLWVLVDMGAAMLDTMPPGEAVHHLAEDVTAADLTEQIAQLWRIDHPRTLDVLNAFADHYPDRSVAKAARKALFRARSSATRPSAAPPPSTAAPPPNPPRAQRKPGNRKRRR